MYVVYSEKIQAHLFKRMLKAIPQLKDIHFRDGEFAERSCARLYKVNSFEIGCNKSELMTMVVDHSPNSDDDAMIVHWMTV